MERQPRTLEQIQATIRAARDSVWVVNDEIQKLTDGQPANDERKDNIERNVAHLKLIVESSEISGSGEDITDLQTAITVGEAKLAENIWS
jgi:predicted  nucleic acid-binding Zn-ribbon protein